MIFAIRCLIVCLYMSLLSITFFFICLLRPFHPQNSYFMGLLMGRPILKILGINFIVENPEQLQGSHPCVYISNHQGNLDIFPISGIAPYKTVSIGKKVIKYIPFFGQIYWLSGHILIDRANKKSALHTMSVASDAISSGDRSIWIMPEGTRSKGQGLLPFKKGAFFTAIQAQAPIIPIVISPYYGELKLGSWSAGTIRIRILDPISTKGKTKNDVGELKELAFELIQKELSKLS